jgi:hypothetical protein
VLPEAQKTSALFSGEKINPFTRLQEICQQNTLNFQDNFDKVAGMKAKE